MPRVNLTDEELRLIEAHRHRMATRDAWNAGVDACREVIRAQFSDSSKVGQLSPNDFDELLQAIRKPLL